MRGTPNRRLTITSVVTAIVSQGWVSGLIEHPRHQVICKIAANTQQILLARDVELIRVLN